MNAPPLTANRAAVARYLNDLFGTSFDRRQVWAWQQRGTLNRNGQPLPVGIPAHPGLAVFDLAAVAAWYAAGVPAPGWNRNNHVWTPAREYPQAIKR